MQNYPIRAWAPSCGVLNWAALVAWQISFSVIITSGAPARELALRHDRPPPHVVFFSDAFLVSAEQDVMVMASGERTQLDGLLTVCAGTLMVTETDFLRCDVERQRYLLRYGQSRDVDLLLEAVQFMTSQFRYNLAIGRESEAGIEGRLGVIRSDLKSAIHLAATTVDDRPPSKLDGNRGLP